jgi:RND family efflux transporter MFP subunit
VPIGNQTLSNEITFLATMSGVEETTVKAKLSDKIVSIPVRVGQRVGAGQILTTFPTDNAQIQWEQARTALENAQKTYERMKNLLAAGDIAQSNFDGAETQYLVAKQNFESLKQMVYIDAPFSGTVINIPAKVGDKVNAGDPLVTIAQIGTMLGKVWANESEVTQLKFGMPASIIIDGKEYKGKIATIALAMDPARKAFQVDVHFPNPKGEIKSGILVDLRFNVGEAKTTNQSVIIPRRILSINGDEQFVYVANGNTAKRINVKTGQVSGTNIEIVEGLQANDQLISEGASLLTDGKKIKIIQ